MIKYWLTYRWHKWRARRCQRAMMQHFNIILRAYPEITNIVATGDTITIKTKETQ